MITRDELAKWAEDTSDNDGDSAVDAADWFGRVEMLNLLWPVVEAAGNVNRALLEGDVVDEHISFSELQLALEQLKKKVTK